MPTIYDNIDKYLEDVELDFIVNYDIKYRKGKALFGEFEDLEEDEE